jgi:hypothetical protein
MDMKKVLCIVLPLCVALSGCLRVGSSDDGGDGVSGSLILRFSAGQLAANTLLPPLDMGISHYDVQGDGPGAATFSVTGVTGGSVIESALVAGTWLFVVDAFNAADTLIGSGSASVTIAAGETAQADVTITPLSGTGTLVIDVSWPLGAITSPSISATLTDASGTPEAISFAVGATSATSTTVLPTGYHHLALQVLDAGVPVPGAGLSEAARILKDQTTHGTYSLTPGVGTASLTLVPNMQGPIEVSFSGQEAVLNPGTDMTVQATTGQPVDAYQWYLDGGLLTGQTVSAITTGSTLAQGAHRLDLVVRKQNIISSGAVFFLVSALPSASATTNAGESGTALQVYVYGGSEFAQNPMYTVWVENMSGVYLQDLFVTTAAGTNIYPFTAGFVARPMSVPYWAHKACIIGAYASYPTMYLAQPTADGGPHPADLDAVTGATIKQDFVLNTKRKADGVTQFRVLLEVNRSRDWNAYYTNPDYEPCGQPSLVYSAAVDLASAQEFYVMGLQGAGDPLGNSGALGGTANVTTALDLVDQIVVRVVR